MVYCKDCKYFDVNEYSGFLEECTKVVSAGKTPISEIGRREFAKPFVHNRYGDCPFFEDKWLLRKLVDKIFGTDRLYGMISQRPFTEDAQQKVEITKIGHDKDEEIKR